MVLGGISAYFKTELVLIKGTMNWRHIDMEFVKIMMSEQWGFLCPHVLYDSACPCITKINQDYMEKQNVPILLWLASSLDLSPIEHLRCIWQTCQSLESKQHRWTQDSFSYMSGTCLDAKQIWMYYWSQGRPHQILINVLLMEMFFLFFIVISVPSYEGCKSKMYNIMRSYALS